MLNASARGRDAGGVLSSGNLARGSACPRLDRAAVEPSGSDPTRPDGSLVARDAMHRFAPRSWPDGKCRYRGWRLDGLASAPAVVCAQAGHKIGKPRDQIATHMASRRKAMAEQDDRRIGGTGQNTSTSPTVFCMICDAHRPPVAVARRPIHRTSPMMARVECRSCG